jgi:hypothetical protein
MISKALYLFGWVFLHLDLFQEKRMTETMGKAL